MSDSRFAQGQELQSRAVRAPATPERPAEAPAADDTTGNASTAEPDLKKREIPQQAPAADRAAAPPAARPVTGADSFFQGNATGKLRADWLGIQSDFVDDPRRAVEQADILVERAATQLADSITARRRELRDQWYPEGADSGDTAGDDSTEQLRTRLKEYRQLLNQLLET